MEPTTSSASELLEAIAWLLNSGWRLLTGIMVPGINISFASLFVGLFLAGLGLRFFGMILGISIGAPEIDHFGGVAQSYRDRHRESTHFDVGHRPGPLSKK